MAPLVHEKPCTFLGNLSNLSNLSNERSPFSTHTRALRTDWSQHSTETILRIAEPDESQGLSTALTLYGYNCSTASVQYCTVLLHQHSINRPCAAMIGRCCPVLLGSQRPVNRSSPVPKDGDAAALQRGNVAYGGHTVVCYSTPPRRCTDNRTDSGTLLWTTRGYHRNLIVPDPPAPAE